VTALGCLTGLVAIWPRLKGQAKVVAGAFMVFVGAFVVFLATVDVRMYVLRYLADRATGREFLSPSEGWADCAGRWVVTFRLEDWADERAWMALYFSVAVWLSLFLARFPRLVRPWTAGGSDSNLRS
jgi:hypothetical protein